MIPTLILVGFGLGLASWGQHARWLIPSGLATAALTWLALVLPEADGFDLGLIGGAVGLALANTAVGLVVGFAFRAGAEGVCRLKALFLGILDRRDRS